MQPARGDGAQRRQIAKRRGARHGLAMRILALFAAAFLLVACATAAPPAPPVGPQTSVANPSGPPPLLPYLTAAGRADAPSVAEIERVAGQPDVRRNDGAGAALTYRLETCALLLVFTADAGNELRLAQTYASARRGGGAAPSLEQCAREAAARPS